MVTFAQGDRLGPYEILGFLSSGGMGEVYRALDPRLGREVAIKVIKRGVPLDAQRLRRFEEEARAAGALCHPNVLTVHDVGRHGDAPFLVLELLHGQTLRALLHAGPLPLRDAIDYAIQVALGLAATHDKGIIHCDLKPENIFITEHRVAKILDFGLARLLEVPDADSADPTVSVLTAPGVPMGTLGYMSPEQVRGIRSDHRTDIFSFGATLFEMLSGRPAFRKAVPADTVTAILRDDPPHLSAMRADVSSALDRLVRRCLEKDPNDRFSSARDLAFTLHAVSAASGLHIRLPAAVASPRVAEAQASARTRTRWRSAALFVAVAIVLAGLALLPFRRPHSPVPVRSTNVAESGRLTILPLTSLPGQELSPAFSPDDQQLAFAWDGGGDNMDIYVKLVDAGPPLRLTTHPGVDGSPAWSPDGRQLAFTRTYSGEASILIIPALGGPERHVANLSAGGRWYGRHPPVVWSPQGRVLAFPDRGSPDERPGIFLLSLDTLEERRLTSPPADSIGDWSPSFSPDGSRLAFVRWSSEGVADIHVAAVDSSSITRITFENAFGLGLAWTPDGQSIVFSSPRGGRVGLWRVVASGGAPEPLSLGSQPAAPAWIVSPPAISHRTHRLAFAQPWYDMNVWRFAQHGARRFSAPREVIGSTRSDTGAQLSPDGRRIAFMSDRSGVEEIWTCDADGTNAAQVTSFGRSVTGTPRWSPDGRQIAFDARPHGHGAIFVIDPEGGEPRRLTSELSNDVVPSWSRDGRWIYFASNRTGTRQVWRIGSDGRALSQVTHDGGFAAFESLDGRDVYYSRFDVPGLWKVPVGGGKEILVVDRLRPGYWGYWGLDRSGVYLVDPEGTPHAELLHYGWSERKYEHVAFLEKPPCQWLPGLSVSPDGSTLLLCQIDEIGSDLMLIENFH